MARRIVLDNCVLAWAFMGESNADFHDERVLHAKKLVKKITEDGDRLIIPSVIVFEFLSVFHDDEKEAREAVFKELAKHVQICDFDFRSAEIAADLFAKSRGGKFDENTRESNRTSSQRKSDIMILAQAEAHDIDYLYTGDLKFIKMAQRFQNDLKVKVENIPLEDQMEIEEQIVKNQN